MSKLVQGYDFITADLIENQSVSLDKTSGQNSLSYYKTSVIATIDSVTPNTDINTQIITGLPVIPQGSQLWYFTARLFVRRSTVVTGTRDYSFRLVLLPNAFYATTDVIDQMQFTVTAPVPADITTAVSMNGFYKFNPVAAANPTRTVAIQYTRGGDPLVTRTELICARIA